MSRWVRVSSELAPSIRLVDDGVRTAFAGSPTEATSRVQSRARRSEAGEWSEDLGVAVYGEDNWVLPGFGESSSKCGEYYPDAVCPECGEPHFGTHSCGRRGCADCWSMWAREAAVKATVRLQAFRYTQPDDWHRQLAHCVVSPPEGSVQSVDSFRREWRKAYRLAHSKGYRGTISIPHPWRLTEEGKRRYRDEKGEDPDVGAWVWMRNEYPGEWRDLTYWSPHFHMVGFTTPDMDPGDTDKDDGYVYHFVRSLSRFSLRNRESYEDLYGTLRYLFSHTGFPEGESFKSVRYAGCISTASFTDQEKPSVGVMSVIERMAEDVASTRLEDDDDSSGTDSDDEEDETPDCRVCGASTIDVFNVPDYIDQAQPPPDISDRMRLAHDWRVGDIILPPGMKCAKTEESAREIWDHLVRQYIT